MDVIYTNTAKEDVGVLREYELDLAFGVDENNFECTVSRESNPCDAGCFLYVDGTEYGGIIDAVETDTASGDMVYSGRTWHGILNSKIIAPDDGEAYLVLNGDANAVIGSLLSRLGLTDLFAASDSLSGLTIRKYKMDRYIEGYNGIKKMLAKVNGKLCMSYTNGVVKLWVTPIVDYTEGVDSDLIEFKAKQTKNAVNHLICLGGGELEKRTVIHLYADAEGNISQTQTLFDLDEYVDVYDYPNAEDEEELISNGMDRLRELQQRDTLSVDFDETDEAYDIGDIVGAVDNLSGLCISVAITKKIVSIKNGRITISYDNPDASSQSSIAAGENRSGNGSFAALDVFENASIDGMLTVQGGANISGVINAQNLILNGKTLLDLTHPVGSYYWSDDPTSPEILFGGTWAQIKDKFILAAGDTYSAGTTGGAATHTLTVDEMPSHRHSLNGVPTAKDTSGYEAARSATFSQQATGLGYTSYEGGGQAHNNMPPYMVAYCWKRISDRGLDSAKLDEMILA